MSDNAARREAEDRCFSGPSLQRMIEDIDRPGKAYATDTYACSGTFDDEPESKIFPSIPRVGMYAAAGVGHARAEWSVFAAEAKGPNASAGVGISPLSGARAFAKAEIASASATAGPVKATVGLAVDTGVGVGPAGVEARLLGTGVTIGRRLSISLLGNTIEWDIF